MLTILGVAFLLLAVIVCTWILNSTRTVRGVQDEIEQVF